MKKRSERECIICTHCGYKWETISNLILVTCPSCQRKTKNILIKLEDFENG